jgi:CheY-like chemotaxis protein
MNKKTILFIEDDKDDLTFSMSAFKENKDFFNYLIMAYDGIQADKYLNIGDKSEYREMSLKPDLIILDLKLPFLGGLEILKKIRENRFTKNIPVVIFTSSDNPEDLIKSYQLGVNSFVKKPVNYEEFIETLKKIIYYWLEVNLAISV